MRRLLLIIVTTAMLCSGANATTVIASWYGPGFHGKKTASGERFNQNAMTAAHKTLPFGTIVAVTYKGKTVNVRINDRGPFVKGRTLDLSKGASRAIGCMATCKVSMSVVGRGRSSAPRSTTTRHRAPLTNKPLFSLKPHKPYGKLRYSSKLPVDK